MVANLSHMGEEAGAVQVGGSSAARVVPAFIFEDPQARSRTEGEKVRARMKKGGGLWYKKLLERRDREGRAVAIHGRGR